MRAALRHFVTTRVIADASILSKYTHGKCSMPSGKFEKMYKEELRQVTLYRILMLVIFLDNAKRSHLLESSPCLYHKNAMIKSSKEFLAILCRDYLHGIGSVFKHLSQINITVSHEQTCIDEFDFSISNLATDLRDGVVIGKLTEYLASVNEHSILSKMRLPAVSRLQKVHNAKIALSAIVDLDMAEVDTIQPTHLVDGHRPQVLKLLWSIISRFTLSSQLDTKRLRDEVKSIVLANRYKRNQQNSCIDLANVNACKDICELLLYWCKAICSCYDYKVENFSSSFASGKVICILIHYYHPSMMNLGSLLPTSKDSGNNESNAFELNERKNNVLAQNKIIDIGGVPNIYPVSDSRNPPDTRCIITCLTYLCARLLESSNEFLAAKVIQMFYRSYKMGKLDEYKKSIVFYSANAKDQMKKDFLSQNTVVRAEEVS
jgi:abnormal spindle-like microcephaly-associated protein